MSSKQKYCLFPKPQFNHLLFLFYFISAMVKVNLFKGTKYINNISVPFFKLFVCNIGDLLSIIPYLILKKKVKSNNISKSINNDNDNNNKENSDLIYNDYKIVQFTKKKKSLILNLFIISILDFLAQTSTVIFYLIDGDLVTEIKSANLNSVLTFNIIFLFLFSKFILNKAFYSHHYFSFIIFIICLIVMAVIDFMGIQSNVLDYILYFVIRVFLVLLYAIVNNLIKIMFLKYYYINKSCYSIHFFNYFFVSFIFC